MALYVYITGFDFMYKNWPLLDFYIHRFLFKGPLTGEWHTFEHSAMPAGSGDPEGDGKRGGGGANLVMHTE